MAAESPFRYLRYVTIEQVFEDCKTPIMIWVAISLVTVVAYWVFGKAASAVVGAAVDNHSESEINSALKAIPASAWVLLFLACFTWAARGKTFTMPTFGFWGWVLCNLAAVGTVTAFTVSQWTVFPVYFGFVILGNTLDTLNDLGRESYESLEAQRQEAETLA